MRFLLFTLLLIPSVLFAQDTIRYDQLIVEEDGPSIKTSYRSQVTGARQYVFLKDGQWKYFDADGRVIKEVGYRASKRDKSHVKHGYEVYMDPDTYDTLLVRRYHKGELKEQLAYRSATILQHEQVISIYRDFGKFSVQEYRYRPQHTDFVSSWTSSIEDPSSVETLQDYVLFEDEQGDPGLLQGASLSALSEFNHVQNPEFEVHPLAPYSIVSFTNQVPYWIQASESPDFYIAPKQARSGTSFIGFRVFTLEKHIEYVQNKLRVPLQKDSTYCFSAYLKLSPGSRYASNAIGVQFTQEMNRIDVDQLLEVRADIELEDQVLMYKTRWMRIQCTYKARGGERWMTIGSFKDHRQLVLHEVPGDNPESYYYLDDVSLVPLHRATDCPCNFSSGTTEKNMQADTEIAEMSALKQGEHLVLKDIHFENDRSTLLPSSFSTLYKLLNVLQQQTGMHIEISGHTSIQGGLEHNIQLSLDRAEAVRRFLVLNGIESERIQVAGHGPRFPIADNSTEEGQALNRRVEFKVLSL